MVVLIGECSTSPSLSRSSSFCSDISVDTLPETKALVMGKCFEKKIAYNSCCVEKKKKIEDPHTKKFTNKYHNNLLNASFTGIHIENKKTFSSIIDNMLFSLKILIEERNEKRELNKKYRIKSTESNCVEKKKIRRINTIDLGVSKEIINDNYIGKIEKKRMNNNSRLIIISYDMSVSCNNEIEWIRKFVLKPNDSVVLIHVTHDLAYAQDCNLKTPGMILVTKNDVTQYNKSMMDKMTNRMQKIYDNYLYDCEVYPVIVPLYNNSKSCTGSILCRFAEELSANMLVVGFHKRNFGAVRNFFFGSISRYVCNHASCPVVLVKT